MAFEIEVRHDGLHKYRLVRGNDSYVVQQKASAQEAQWEAMWERKQASEAKRQAREQKAQNKEEKLKAAAERTQEALGEINRLENILAHTLSIDDTIEWESLKDTSEFMEPKPKVPVKQKYPSQPQRSVPAYDPKLGLLDYIFPSRKRKRLQEAENLLQEAKNSFKTDQEQWRRTKERREYWDNYKPLEDIIRGCQGMIRSYNPIEKERVRILAKALGDTFKREYEQSRQDLIDLIQNKYSYNEPDLLEICLAVSWEKSKDAKGGNERLASIMTRGARIDYGDSTLTELYELSPRSFRQRMYRNRNKAKKFDFHDVIPPDYWKLFVGASSSDINEVIDILDAEWVSNLR